MTTRKQTFFFVLCTMIFLSRTGLGAFVAVNEEGTEATAAAVAKTTRVRRAYIFRADRPFLFLIRDIQTGTILFMGRIHNPTQ